jgi:hypothetical protein
MPTAKTTCDLPPDAPRLAVRKDGIEYGFTGTPDVLISAKTLGQTIRIGTTMKLGA